MKKIFTIAFIALLSFFSNASAQKINISAKAGYQINSYSIDKITGTSPTGETITTATAAPVNGLTFGVGGEGIFNKHILLSIEALYERKEFKTTFPTATTNYSQNYISTPIKAGLQFGQKVFGVAYLGATPSFLINSKASGINGEQSKTTKYASSIAIAGLAELGAGYQITNKIAILGTARYNVGLTDAFKSEVRNINGKFSSTAILISIRVTLIKSLHCDNLIRSNQSFTQR